jgi:hypothetical protein
VQSGTRTFAIGSDGDESISFGKRLHALSRAHNVPTREKWESCELKDSRLYSNRSANVNKLWAKSSGFDEEGRALVSGLAERISSGVRDAAGPRASACSHGANVHLVTEGWLQIPGGLLMGVTKLATLPVPASSKLGVIISH